jgi:hypothetical protein
MTMSSALASMLAVSLLGLLACVWYWSLRRVGPRRVALAALLTALAVLALRSAFAPGPLESKGAVHETIAIAFCYGAMVLGMLAQYAYHQANTRDFRFDAPTLLMPIFASPIVFIPLLAVIGELDATGALATPKLMVYLVAFQNGFFWRSFFAARASS